MNLLDRKYASMDGNEAAAAASYPFIETSFLYPITPSTPAAEIVEEWSSKGKKNLFGDVVTCREMQAEGGVAGALHGSLVSGSLCATYTCSQGLLLMIPNMLKIAYEMLPCVIHVASRLVAYHAMSLFCDYSDVYACRDTGFALLCSSNPQECLDLGTVAHLVTSKCHIPFLHFYDGFRTSHSIHKIETIPESVLLKLYPYEEVKQFKQIVAMNPEHSSMRGCAQNSDIWWSCSERTTPYFLAVPGEVNDMMRRFGELTGRYYHTLDYFGADDAEDVVVLMGSGTNTVIEVVRYLNTHSESDVEEGRLKGGKFGVIKIRLYRPFPVDDFVKVIPKTCKRLCILDRIKTTTATGEPLYLDCLAALHSGSFEDTESLSFLTHLSITNGKFGVGGYEFNPLHALAVFSNMRTGKPKRRFCVGINDDVSHTSLAISRQPVSTVCEGTVQAKFFGLGSDGTVGSCKAAITLIGENTSLYTQSFTVYDAKKTGGFTFSHLRFGKEPMLSEYEVYDGDYVACHHHSFLEKFNVTESLKTGGIFVLNSPWETAADLEANLPVYFKRDIARKRASFYVINAYAVAAKAGLSGLISTVLIVCFFRTALAHIVPINTVIELLKQSVRKQYSKKGEDVVAKNVRAIDSALEGLHAYQYDSSTWSSASEPSPSPTDIDLSPLSLFPDFAFAKQIVFPIARQEGHKLSVSDVTSIAQGRFPSNTTHFEKRGVAQLIPQWDPTNCVQCNSCSFVCPHACIRPFIFDPAPGRDTAVPESFVGIELRVPVLLQKNVGRLETTIASTAARKGAEEAVGRGIGIRGEGEGGGEGEKKEKGNNWKYRIQVSPRDCLGCGLCVKECPKKCLTLRPFGHTKIDPEDANWTFAATLPRERGALIFDYNNEFTSRDAPVAAAADASSYPSPPPSFSFLSRTTGASSTTTLTIPVPSHTQYHQPLLEFHNACAGCTEPVHAKILTQLFGGQLYVANAVGCSMVWGSYTPTSSYVKDWEGVGPVYATSLFEDNAEFGLGIAISLRHRRAALRTRLLQYVQTTAGHTAIEAEAGGRAHDGELLVGAVKQLIDNFDDLVQSRNISRVIKEEVAKIVTMNPASSSSSPASPSRDSTQILPASQSYLSFSPSSPNLTLSSLAAYLHDSRDLLAAKSMWVFGGDGWAYDIDFHGVDHLLHSGEDVNVLIFDTEVYSNTGGQASKATQRGAVAKLQSLGKVTPKKDFGLYAMNLGVCYVASVCVGFNKSQFIRACVEAVQYKGVSVLICYCPCIAHGMRGGLASTNEQQKLAVQSGYWPLYRFNPTLLRQRQLNGNGKWANPLHIDFEPPLMNLSVSAFLSSSPSSAAEPSSCCCGPTSTTTLHTPLDKLKAFLSNEIRFKKVVENVAKEEKTYESAEEEKAIVESLLFDVQLRNKRLKKMLDVWEYVGASGNGCNNSMEREKAMENVSDVKEKQIFHI